MARQPAWSDQDYDLRDQQQGEQMSTFEVMAQWCEVPDEVLPLSEHEHQDEPLTPVKQEPVRVEDPLDENCRQ